MSRRERDDDRGSDNDSVNGHKFSTQEGRNEREREDLALKCRL